MSVARLNGNAGIELGEDFPVVCDACLGPNPYTRMIKSENAKECRISGQPFTAFRWQGALKRWKETLVCSTVAREKNCCQACMNDLEYAVPFHVRDQVMEALGDAAPTSDVSKEFYWMNKRQKLVDAANGAGTSGDSSGGGVDTYDKLQDNMDRLRELAAIEATPVTWSHRPPLTAEEQERLRQRRQAEKRPPADPSVTSLYVGGVPPAATKQDLLPYFLPYGAVRELTVDTQRLAAIVTFQGRRAAEAACEALYNNFTYKGSRLRVGWARRKGTGVGSGSGPSSTDTVTAAGHEFYGRNARQVVGEDGSSSVPPRVGSVASGGGHAKPPGAASALPGPPGVRLPPGIRKRPAAAHQAAQPAPSSSTLYPSMTKEGHAMKGVRPDKDT